MGDSFIIQACISKFYDLIPTTRFAKILARSNTAVSHGLLLKAQSTMAFVLTSVYRAIKKEIMHSGVVFADETIHRQLEENNGNWRWYLCFLTLTPPCEAVSKSGAEETQALPHNRFIFSGDYGDYVPAQNILYFK